MSDELQRLIIEWINNSSDFVWKEMPEFARQSINYFAVSEIFALIIYSFIFVVLYLSFRKASESFCKSDRCDDNIDPKAILSLVILVIGFFVLIHIFNIIDSIIMLLLSPKLYLIKEFIPKLKCD